MRSSAPGSNRTGEPLRPALAVIVCSYNRHGVLDDTLSSIDHALAQFPLPYECVVVDDGSDPPVSVASREHLAVQLIRLDQNRGASAARNAGAAATAAEWLLFVDDDVVLDAAGVNALWGLRSEKECHVPIVRRRDGTVENATVGRRSFGEWRFDYAGEPRALVAYPVGSCFLIARECYHRVGGFDERFVPNYCEDSAFGLALWRAGYAVRMNHEATFVHDHHGGERTAAGAARRRRVAERNRWLLLVYTSRRRSRWALLLLGSLRATRETLQLRSLVPVGAYRSALVALWSARGSGRRLLGMSDRHLVRTVPGVDGDPA